MQPDPLHTPQEETQPEPISPEVQPIESLSTQESAKPEPVAVQEMTNPAPTPVIQKKKPAGWSIAAIVLGLLAVLLLVVATGLGFWAYTLNTKLTTAQQQLTDLQATHDKLQADHATLVSDHEKMNTDFTQTKSDLEKSKADLATAQADLKKAQDQNKTLTEKISKASKLTDVLYAWFTAKDASDILAIDSKVKAANDAKLTSLWSKFMAAPSNDNTGLIIMYITTAIHDGLK